MKNAPHLTREPHFGHVLENRPARGRLLDGAEVPDVGERAEQKLEVLVPHLLQAPVGAREGEGGLGFESGQGEE